MKLKLTKMLTLGSVLIAAVPALAAAQAAGTQGMDMKEMDMKGMDMNGMQMEAQPNAAVHEAKGVVKRLDTAKGLVTIAHGPVATLNWRAMTMTFKVKDNTLLEKIEVGKEVRFGFVQQDGAYVVTRIE